MPAEVVAGDETVVDAVEGALDAVMEAGFVVAVGVDDLFDMIFFCETGEAAFFFKDVCRRVMQEHDELLAAVAGG